jgi:hypothetical protein
LGNYSSSKAKVGRGNNANIHAARTIFADGSLSILQATEQFARNRIANLRKIIEEERSFIRNTPTQSPPNQEK